MIRLAAVIGQFEADFLTQFRHRLSFDQLRALSAIRQCRSQASPMMQVQCSDCDHQRLVPHCPGDFAALAISASCTPTASA